MNGGTPRRHTPRKQMTPRRTPAKKEKGEKHRNDLGNDQGEEGIQGTNDIL
jgi:hypothetical protein